MKLRVLDLFSGIGGFSIGLERTNGFQTVAFCETNDYAERVLKKWWPEVPNFRHGIIGLNALLRRVPMSSRRDFHARTYPTLGPVPDLPEPVRDSSGHYYEPFAWFDRNTRSWRTWQRCLVEGWEPFSGTWPRSGMTRSGIAYRRAPLVRLTDGTVSGSLLPTPEASNTKAVALRSAGRSPRNFLAPLPTPRPCTGKRSSGANRTEIMRALEKWPTPHANCHTGAGSQGRKGGLNLQTAVKFATPTARDWRSGKASPETHAKNSRPLSEQIGGALNPTWVEWLMGFPLGWTDLAVLETPLSPKSQSSGAKPSSKQKKRKR